MTDAAQTPPPTVWPALRARDARKLIDFLVEAFGFEEVVTYEDGGIVEHAELAGPAGGGVMLGSVREEAGDHWSLRPGSSGCYVVVTDTDAVYERAVAAGAEITREPHDTDYGSRDFAARDPEGNLWSFGTYPGQPH